MKPDQIPAAIVSVIVLALFGTALALSYFHEVPAGNADILKIMLGVLGTLSTGVVFYWVGSTQSGARKDATIANQGQMLALAAPNPHLAEMVGVTPSLVTT